MTAPSSGVAVSGTFSKTLAAPKGLSSWQQYALALVVFVAVSLLNFWLQKWIGYQAIALVYLLSVVLLALFINRGATLLGTVLTAAGWNYIFAPPPFAFNVSDTYDNMMLLTYFVVTLTVGQLTTRLRAQREAELKSKLLAESERLGRTLLRSVSHELRTPIAAIASAAHSLHSRKALSNDEQSLVEEIESASTRLTHVVQNLLSAARIQSQQVHPKLDWCDIADLIQATVYDLRGQLLDHPIETRVPADLPLVMADPVLTAQAFANLIVNAATHTPPGTPIQITGRFEAGFLAISVADSGPGLPPDQLEQVFEPFHRGDKTKTGGVGLGLAIVKGFIEAQNGFVKAGNRSEGGAEFTIHLNASQRPDLPEEIL